MADIIDDCGALRCPAPDDPALALTGVVERVTAAALWNIT